MLVCCILLNQTQRKQVDRIIDELFQQYPTPEAMADAEVAHLEPLLHTLGLSYQRAARLKRFSAEWRLLLETLAYLGAVDIPMFLHMLGELHGIGDYALDSYRMFVLDEWRSTYPVDKELRKWKRWRSADAA